MPSPSQTIGPMYGFALMFEGSNAAEDPGASGAVRIEGLVIDGDGEPVRSPDVMVEVWHGDQWARGRTDETGLYRVCLRRPASTTLPGGETLAPHLNVAVFAVGLLKQAQTRMYFPDESANAVDPVLASVPPERRHTLIATAVPDGHRFDIRLQGPDETVFFDFT